jgi:hypothetical protein
MSRAAFTRRRGVNRERVDAACEFSDKRFVNHAVALEPALPAERLRHNVYPEMSLPALAMSSMPSVLVGFVHHVEARGSESVGQLLRNEVSSCHGVRIAAGGPPGQCRFTAPIYPFLQTTLLRANSARVESEGFPSACQERVYPP